MKLRHIFILAGLFVCLLLYVGLRPKSIRMDASVTLPTAVYTTNQVGYFVAGKQRVTFFVSRNDMYKSNFEDVYVLPATVVVSKFSKDITLPVRVDFNGSGYAGASRGYENELEPKLITPAPLCKPNCMQVVFN